MAHAPTDALARRHHAIRTDIAGRGLDALVVTALPNVTYLTNFTGSAAIVVLTDRLHFLTDSRYVTAVSGSSFLGTPTLYGPGNLAPFASSLSRPCRNP